MTYHRHSGWPVHLQLPTRQNCVAKTWQLRIHGPTRSPAWFSWSPPTDVFETDEGGLVRVEIAGMSDGELELTFRDGRLVIDGQRRDPLAERGRACSLKEIASGRFRVDLDIPWQVDVAHIRAAYVDGFLTVALPRAAGA